MSGRAGQHSCARRLVSNQAGPCVPKAVPENTRRVRLPLGFSGANSHSFGAQMCVPAQGTPAIVKRELLHFDD
jgi:hypothetical protein